MFCAGDLISIPSDVKMLKESKDCNLIESYKITNKPEIGIFITYTDSGRCLVNTDGDKWSVEPNHLRIYEVKYDKVSSNRKSLY